MKERQSQINTIKNNEIDVLSIIGLLLRKAHLLAIAGIAMGAVVYLALSLLVTPTYQSSVSFYVYNNANITANSGAVNNNDLQAAQSLATTYSKILESNSVLNVVVDDISRKTHITRKELSEMTKVSVIPDTQLLNVVVTTSDPNLSRDIANSFAKSAPTEIVRVTKAGGVEVVDSPEIPTEKSSPRTVFDTAIGIVAGILFMAIFLILKSMSDTTIYLAEDIEKLVDVAVIGQIPEISIPSGNYEAWKTTKGGAVRFGEKKD